jgi:beta-galactosidase
MSFEDHGSHDHDNASGAIMRWRALQLGATTVGALGVSATGALARLERAPSERDSSCDEGWRVLIGDRAGARAPGFDDSGGRLLDLPHDWSIEDLSYFSSV